MTRYQLQMVLDFLREYPAIAKMVAETLLRLRPELQQQLNGGAKIGLPAIAKAAIASMEARLAEIQVGVDEIRKADAQRASLARANTATHKNGHLKEVEVTTS